MIRSFPALADASIVGGVYADTNFGSAPAVQIGNVRVSSVDYENRALVAFDLSIIPSTAIITRATLYLMRTGSGVFPTLLTFYVRSLIGTFVESGVTFNRRDAATPWTVPGGDVSMAIASQFQVSPPAAAVPLLVDVETHCSAAITSGGLLGLLLSGPVGGGVSQYLDVHSLQAASAGDRPYLEVEYYVPTPKPQGPMMVPLGKLVDMLADCPAVQERFGVSGSDVHELAQKRIYYPVLEDEQIPHQLPAIIVGEGEAWDYSQHSGGSHNYLRPSGSALVIFAAKTRYPGHLESGKRDFGNWIGVSLQQLAERAGVSSKLSIHNIRQQMPPALCSREHEDTFGLYFIASYLVDWS